MNRNQWFVLAGMLLLAIAWITFFGIDWNCSSIEDKDGYTKPNTLNPTECAVQYQVYSILNNIVWFLMFVCIIMGLLEPKKNK